MSERPVEPEDYGDASAETPASTADSTGRTSSSGPPPSANQMKAEPEPADVEPDDAERAPAALMAAARSSGDRAVRVAHVVPGHPDGEVDTTR